MKQVSKLLAGLLLALVVSGCQGQLSGQGRLRILLTDAPADAKHVYVTVSEVQAHREGYAWETVVDTPQTFDLLTLRNGAEAVLGDRALPPGSYTQLRLVVSQASIVLEENGVDTTYPVFVPSGVQSGIKLNLQFEVRPTEITTLLLDFDAARSIVETPPGSHNYLLKPVIRGVAKVISGSISGRVVAAGSGSPLSATVTVLDAANTEVASTLTDPATGAFKVVALVEGSYRVRVAAEGYQEKLLENVGVVAGQDTNLGSIALEPSP
jgi:hypothetical protein